MYKSHRDMKTSFLEVTIQNKKSNFNSFYVVILKMYLYKRINLMSL